MGDESKKHDLVLPFVEVYFMVEKMMIAVIMVISVMHPMIAWTILL